MTRARDEPRGAILLRRLRTVPAVALAWLLVTVTFPVLLIAALVVDAVRRVRSGRPWVALRLLAFLWIYLAAETLGVLVLAGIWVLAGGGRARRRMIAWTYALQRVWAATQLRALAGLFRLRFEIEGDAAVAPAPMILLVRHASIVDNLLPAAFVSARHRIPLRYVLKRELRSDPCLDIAGGRLPNYFVDRESADSAGEAERICELARGAEPGEGLLIYPEGTRFTAAKLERALERLESRPELHARARGLRHVLPPRLGGPLALLDGAPEADVVVLAHHGFDGFAHLSDIWNGSLVGTTVAVRFWRVPRAEVPAGRDARAAWLYDQWRRLDDWIDARAVARGRTPA